MSPPRRAGIHARVVSALAAQPGGADNARLAHHAELAGLRRDACRYAAWASVDAERVGALQETRLQAERALRLGEELAEAERFELLMRYSRAANFSSTRYEDAVTGAEQALAIAERLGDPLRQAQALGALAWALWSFDRMLEAKEAAERAVAALEGTSEIRALAQARSTRIRMEATAFDPKGAIDAGPGALELARSAGLEEVRIDVQISLGLAHGHRGERRGLDMLEDALAASRRAGLAIQTVRSYVNLMCVAASLRDHSLLDRTFGEASAFCEEHDAPIPRCAIEGYLARSLLDRGRWGEAAAAASRCLRIWHSEVPLGRVVHAIIAARRGDRDAGRGAERAWEEIPKLSEDSRHSMIRCALIEAAWLRGDERTALQYLHAARSSPASSRYARPGGALALWASRYGVDFELPAGAPKAIELELQGDWRRAVHAWREFEAPYEAALAALPGDDRAARNALRVLHQLGAGAAAQAFGRERAARGARAVRGPRRSTLANPAGLTRREQEVLMQLATGASNPEIAAVLHLSERTVAHHVSAILAKLGASNRHAAIEQARTLGVLAR